MTTPPAEEASARARVGGSAGNTARTAGPTVAGPAFDIGLAVPHLFGAGMGAPTTVPTTGTHTEIGRETAG